MYSTYTILASAQKLTTLAWYSSSDSHVPLGFLLICVLRKVSRLKMFVR